nr:hypothetical protein [Thermosynechococcus vestitus]
MKWRMLLCTAHPFSVAAIMVVKLSAKSTLLLAALVPSLPHANIYLFKGSGIGVF